MSTKQFSLTVSLETKHATCTPYTQHCTSGHLFQRKEKLHSHKQTKKLVCTGEWLNKLWYIHTKDYYSAIIKSKLLIHTTRWMTQKIKMTIPKGFILCIKDWMFVAIQNPCVEALNPNQMGFADGVLERWLGLNELMTLRIS